MNSLTLHSPAPWTLAWQRLLAARRQQRRARRDRAVFQQLDGATLRDLGLDRSEYESCCAEARGDTPRTRLRLETL